MLEVNMDDVLAVLGSIAPQLIAIGIALVAALIVTFAVNKRTMGDGARRKLTHSLAWVLASVVVLVAVNLMLTGPLSNMVTMARAPKQQLSQASIDKTNDLAIDIENEGITLLQNDDSALPLARGSK